MVRASGSVAANYIEANEKLVDKDFLMKIRISKKECKESILRLRLLDVEESSIENKRSELINEASELKNILGSIYKNTMIKQSSKI